MDPEILEKGIGQGGGTHNYGVVGVGERYLCIKNVFAMFFSSTIFKIADKRGGACVCVLCVWGGYLIFSSLSKICLWYITADPCTSQVLYLSKL